MKAILTKDVTNLGREGDLVRVAPGYFRNFLAPKQFAKVATEANLSELKFKAKRIEIVRAQKKAEATTLADKLKTIELEIRHRCGEKGQLFGAVTVSDIAESLKGAGYEVDRRKIVVHDPIKAIGKHEASIRVYPEVTAKIRITVKPEANQEAEINALMAKAEEMRKADEAVRKAAEAAKAAAAEAAPAAEGEVAPAAAEPAAEEVAEKPAKAKKGKKGE